MTVPIAAEGIFDTNLTGRELEPLLSVIRDTASTATSAAATAILLSEDPGTGGSTPITLISEGPVDRALLDFCLDTDRSGTSEDRPHLNVSRPFRSRHITLHGSDYLLLALPFSGQKEAARGLFAFALHATSAPLDAIVETCCQLTRCAEMMWAAHEDTALLSYEVVSLANHTARLQRLSETDALTQLENPTSFEDKVRLMIEAGVQNAAFVALDIDHFKLINDLYGHQFGDLYLKTIARALRSSFPNTSVIGRLGGDEFGIFTPIPSGGRPYIEGLLNRCRSSIQRATAVLGKPDLGKVSIGASQFPDHGRDFAALYDRADAALYAAKAGGRSINAVYKPSQHRRYNSTELGSRFRTAVAQGDIRPYFQPIIDLSDGRCAGFEILARWRAASGEHLEPSEFSALFRDHTIAETMTRTIMTAAFHDFVNSVPRTERPLRLALNVTFFDLMNPEFAFEVQQAVTDTGFDWNHLTIEVTEQTMLGETNGQIFRSLKEVRARGARVALDDFGTGYGGLRHVADWPIDTVKIDKFFIDGLAGSRRDRAVLTAVLSMCRDLDLNVVAEGIETPQQIEILRDMGCAYGQGFAFDHPLSGEELPGYRHSYTLP